MKITLSSNNRITIPKTIINELNLTIGQQLDLIIEDGRIILSTEEIHSKESIKEEDKIIETKELETNIVEEEILDSNNIPENRPVIKTTNNIKIESNLTEGEKFSRKIYSECGLVIRTKNSYMNKFCEACQGELSKQYGVDKHPCKYIKESQNKIENSNLEILKQLENNKPNLSLNAYISTDEDVQKAKEIVKEEKPTTEISTIEEVKEQKPSSIKDIIFRLTKNVDTLNKKLDQDIEKIEDKKEIINEEDKAKQLDNRKFTSYKPSRYIQDFPPRDEYTTIKSVILSEGLKPCNGCGELCNRGFLLDSDFYCKKCTKNDFIHYLKKGGRK